MIQTEARYSDNSFKTLKRILLHWTASQTARSAMDWLDTRLEGKGTVGYNYIIEKNGMTFRLIPDTSFFHNSGLGKKYDSDTISIAFVSMSEYPTLEQIRALVQLITKLQKKFDIFEIRHHAGINNHKQDFPKDYWERLKLNFANIKLARKNEGEL